MDKIYDISGEVLSDPDSPQKAAYDWLKDEDLSDVDLEDLSERDLMQRYVATVLYFSTNGSNWDNSYGFLGEGDVCTWQDEKTKRGITCDSTGAIVDLTISKYLATSCH